MKIQCRLVKHRALRRAQCPELLNLDVEPVETSTFKMIFFNQTTLNEEYPMPKAEYQISKFKECNVSRYGSFTAY